MRIEQVNARQVAFLTPCGLEARCGSHGQELCAESKVLQLAEEEIEPYAVTSDDHQIGHWPVSGKQLHLDRGALLDNLLVAADGHEAVRAAERGDRAGALTHGVGDQADVVSGRRLDFAAPLDQPH